MPGKHGQQDLIAAPSGPVQTPNPLQNHAFSDLARLSLSSRAEPRLGRAGGSSDPQTAWEGCADRSKGRTTDGEYASRRTFAADGARAAARRGRQQHRERQHHRLQGRQVAVRGISELERARRQLRRRRPPRQLRAGPRHLPRPRSGPDASRPTIRSMSPSTATASWWCRRRPASATPATARCRSTTRASSSRWPATRCSAPAARSCSSRPTTTSRSPPTAPITVLEGVNRTSTRSAASCGSSASPTPQQLLKEGSNLFSAAAGVAARSPTPASQVQQGFDREIQRQFGRRDDAA